MKEDNHGLTEKLVTQLKTINRLIIPGVNIKLDDPVSRYTSDEEFHELIESGASSRVVGPGDLVRLEDAIGRRVYASYSPNHKQFRMWLDRRPTINDYTGHYGGGMKCPYLLTAEGLMEPVQSIIDLLTPGWEKDPDFHGGYVCARGGFSEE